MINNYSIVLKKGAKVTCVTQKFLLELSKDDLIST